ncbi:riboflavin synthase [Janibacter alkaliphilus]|uniref:Riboflavin synthase n=1 Tax=Janibacter alkaliphilus TaxID=1069963 RepID=A0A852WYP2_9MICO|nr:riboflavin synthase [Janibacter alkaliphilus]NYG35729.1 riboflavin synthase [Janibacter alkaliphilus]
MFTGIIEELGEVVAVETAADSARLSLRGPLVMQGVVHGASIAVDGVCLTVADEQPDGPVFTADVMAETLTRSTLGGLRPGDRVNLERAAPVAGRLDGHLVQGHVDGVGRIVAREPGERWETVRVGLPPALARYVVEKGSVAVDGTSLTVTGVSPVGDPEPTFAVGLVPTTLELTTLGRKQVGDRVNLEVDVLAKYVERLLSARELTDREGAA